MITKNQKAGKMVLLNKFDRSKQQKIGTAPRIYFSKPSILARAFYQNEIWPTMPDISRAHSCVLLRVFSAIYGAIQMQILFLFGICKSQFTPYFIYVPSVANVILQLALAPIVCLFHFCCFKRKSY